MSDDWEAKYHRLDERFIEVARLALQATRERDDARARLTTATEALEEIIAVEHRAGQSEAPLSRDAIIDRTIPALRDIAHITRRALAAITEQEQ